MAGQRETPQDRQRRDEALAASAEAAEQEDRDAAAEAAEQLAAISAAASTPSDRAFVASASRIMLNDRRALAGLRRSRQAWQSEAWDYSAEIGELGYTVAYAANMISKIRLFPAVKPDPQGDPVPVDDEDSGVSPDVAKIALATLARLRSPQGGQAALLRALDWNFEICGEAYLHGHEDPETGEQWQIRSVDELVVNGDRFALRTAMTSQAMRDLPDGDLVSRLWDPDPRFSDLATSPVRRVLAVCENLLLLTRAMRADAMSHLNNGFLVKAQELSQGPKDPTQQEGDGETDDPFEVNVRETIIAPIETPGSAASVAPGIITGPAEYIKPDVLRHLTFSRPMDALLSQWIENLVLRLARGLNMPVEVSVGLMACVDDTTEILSERGWLTVDTLRAGDVVLTLDHETGMAEWQPVEAVSVYDAEHHPMLLVENKSHSSLTTLNHRWPVIDAASGRRIWRQSETLTANHRAVTAAPCADLPVEAKWSDAFVETVAWFYTEGSVDRRGYAGEGGLGIITQDDGVNPGNVVRIRSALTEVFGPASDTLHATGPIRWWGDDAPLRRWPTDANTGRTCGRCGIKEARNRGGRPVCQECASGPLDYREPQTEARPQRAVVAWIEVRDARRNIVRFRLSHAATATLEAVAPDRYPTAEFIRSLTAGQLELFMAVSRMADGWTVNSGTRMFSQSEQGRVDPYELAVILSGRTPSRWTVVGTRRYPDHRQYYCSVTDRATVQPLRGKGKIADGHRQEVVDYTGRVWCPTTPNQTWLARRDGRVYFTGNTTFANAAQVKKSEWDAHGEPRAVLVVDAITAGYFRDALIAAGVDRATAEEIFVWYDPSDAIAAPDPTESVDKGSEEGLLRDETWRRVRGFSEADAPSPDDMLIRLAYHATRMDPFIAAQLLKRSGLFPDIQIPAPAGGILGEDGTVQGGPPPNGPATAADVTAAVLVALSAAGVVKGGSAGARLGRRLAAIDRDLRAKLLVACEQAMRRFLEKAGAKVRSKVAGRGRDDPAARIASGSPFREVCARLGREVVTAAGIGEADLLDGAFDELGDDFSAWVDLAQTQAHTAVTEAVGLAAPAADALAAAQEAARARAAEALRAAMTELAGRRLFDASAGAPAMGEQDSTTTIPAWVVRQAMAIAGGDQPEGGDGTPMRSAAGGPAGGVAAGPDVLGVAGSTEAYEWDYGSAPRIPFEPHASLDGIVFGNFDDDVLANEGGWPDTPYYQPGDHDGCVCNAVPILVLAGESDGSEGEGDGG